MNDYISRQAAIDICNDELLHTEDYSPIRTWGRIMALPSAQPEPSQVARDIATIIENEHDMRVLLSQPERKKGAAN